MRAPAGSGSAYHLRVGSGGSAGSGRRRRLVGAVSAAIVATLLAVATAWFLGGPANPTSVGSPGPAGAATTTAAPNPATTAASTSPTSTTDASRAVQDAAADLTAKRVDALAAKDRSAWLATLADPRSQFGTDQGDLFDRMTRLPLARLSTRGISVEPGSGGGGGTTWVANLRLGYTLTGYDRSERPYRLSYLVTRTADGWRFSGAGPGASDPQPFDLPDLEVVSSPSTLVIGNSSAATLRAYLTLGDKAREQIEAIWGSSVPGVLVLPRSVDELATQLGIPADSLAQVAGITTGPVGDGAAAQSDRVYVNPDATAKLSQIGRQVIVTHELTHVATRATTVRRPPLWVSEGFADYIGLKSAGLPVASVASALLDEVRAGTVPTALPGADAFDPAKATIEPAYNEAWLAITLMRRTYGEEKVVEFYRAIAGSPADPAPPSGTSVDDLTRAAFQNVLGTTPDAFVSDWRAYLTRLVR